MYIKILIKKVNGTARNVILGAWITQRNVPFVVLKDQNLCHLKSNMNHHQIKRKDMYAIPSDYDKGMTIRELVSSELLKGLLSNPNIVAKANINQIVKLAVKYTDNLFEELQKNSNRDR